MPWRKILRIVYPTDLITIAYILLTGIFIFFSALKLNDVAVHLTTRVFLVGVISLFIYLDYTYPSKLVRFVRHFYPLALLCYFYPETDYLNNIFFPNLDPWVANLEVTIFGGHPSIWFSEYFPWRWFSELMNLGYFSFYILIFILCYKIYRDDYEDFSISVFIICMSFYIYYFIFIFFPVAGPQFYFAPPDNLLPDGYLFSKAVAIVHEMGERPTAAFPSSHVGIMCLLLVLASKYAPKLLKWYIPIGIILILSTVYIKAHYAIDVIAGVLTVPTLYWISIQAYNVIVQGLSQEIKVQLVYEKIRVWVNDISEKIRQRQNPFR
ncbi:MAG: phosphatase PAP2 family protein [Bacteroidota bacterium]|nr:phosphatase PAP2 family protein [Bacteroidota bacterium]